jgi:hypothetical protein
MSSGLGRRGFLRGMGQAAAAVSPTGRALASAGTGASKALDMGKAMRDIISGKGLPGMPSDWNAIGKKINDVTRRISEKIYGNEAEFSITPDLEGGTPRGVLPPAPDFIGLGPKRTVTRVYKERINQYQNIREELNSTLFQIGNKLDTAAENSTIKVVTNILEKSDPAVARHFANLFTGELASELDSFLRDNTTKFGSPLDYDFFDTPSIDVGNYLETMGDMQGGMYDIYDTVVANNFDKPENKRAFAEFIHKNARPRSAYAKPISSWTQRQFDDIDMSLNEGKFGLTIFRQAREIMSKVPVATLYEAYRDANKGINVLENILGKELPRVQDLMRQLGVESTQLKTELAKGDAARSIEQQYRQLRDTPLPPGVQWTTLGQDRAWRDISEFFPEVNSQELNLPKGNKDLAEFARKLNDDINRQVEMGEPATKPYDCR